MGSVFVMLIVSTFSYRVLGFGNLTHMYDNYVNPGRPPALKNGNGFHSEGTMTHNYAVKPELVEHIKKKTSEHLKIIAVFSCIIDIFFHL